MMKKNGENTDAIQEEVRKLGDEIKVLEEKQVEFDTKQRDRKAFGRFPEVLRSFFIII